MHMCKVEGTQICYVTGACTHDKHLGVWLSLSCRNKDAHHRSYTEKALWDSKREAAAFDTFGQDYS